MSLIQFKMKAHHLLAGALAFAYAVTADSDSDGDGDGDAESKINMVTLAHGVLAPLCIALLFPMGAITIRLFHSRATIWVHASWEAFTYMLALAAMGMGIWVAQMTEQLDSNHAIIGMVVISSLIFQPITGLTHHLIANKGGRRSVFTRLHIWWGRAVITLGAINGVLGLQLAETSKKSQIVYGVLAAAFWLSWVAVVAFVKVQDKREETQEKSMGSSNSRDPRSLEVHELSEEA